MVGYNSLPDLATVTVGADTGHHNDVLFLSLEAIYRPHGNATHVTDNIRGEHLYTGNGNGKTSMLSNDSHSQDIILILKDFFFHTGSQYFLFRVPHFKL